jgi:hypothetical protein
LDPQGSLVQAHLFSLLGILIHVHLPEQWQHLPDLVLSAQLFIPATVVGFGLQEARLPNLRLLNLDSIGTGSIRKGRRSMAPNPRDHHDTFNEKYLDRF